MGKLRDRLEEIRQKPHAVRERYAAISAFVLIAIMLGGWYGVRLGIQRVRTASDGPVSASPFAVVRSTVAELKNFMNQATEELPSFNELFGAGDLESPTSSLRNAYGLGGESGEPADIGIESPSSTATPSAVPSEDVSESTLEEQNNLQSAFGIDTVPTTSQDE